MAGTDTAKHDAVSSAYRLLNRRIYLSTSLPIQKLDGLSFKKQLGDIGRTQD